MFKNLFVTIVLGVSAIGFMCCTVGCGGPGAVIEGKADNSKFAQSSETDPEGREIPRGLGRVD